MNRQTVKRLLELKAGLNAMVNPPAAVREVIDLLVLDAYEQEFEVVDGLRQHRDGQIFPNWKQEILFG